MNTIDLSMEIELEEDLANVVPTADAEGSTQEFPKPFEIPSESNIVPKGLYLGLDISKDSTGVCVYKDGIRFSGNISVTADNDSPHSEVLLRRSLKQSLLADLTEFLDQTFDLIIIEDVFEGVNPETVRTLYALNTAIDEAILDGQIKTKKFVRVNNRKWKSWLFWLDAEGKWKGYNDKVKITEILKSIGIDEYGAGCQDRLDAAGMLIGYFLQGSKSQDKKVDAKPKYAISFSDLSYAYESDVAVIKDYIYGEREICNIFELDTVQLSKKFMTSTVAANLGGVFVTSEPIRLGFFGDSLGLRTIPEGGYFAFWLKKKVYNKLLTKGVISDDV